MNGWTGEEKTTVSRQADVPMSADDELRIFARDPFRKGVYVLPCGGGVISEPRKAIYYLRSRYGDDGLRRRCLRLVRQETTCPDNGEGLLEGVWSTATGILYHLADEEVLAELWLVFQSQARNRPELPHDGSYCILGSVESLIVLISNRLQRPLPTGVRPLPPDGGASLLWSDEPPPSAWELLLLPLAFSVDLILISVEILGDLARRCFHRLHLSRK